MTLIEDIVNGAAGSAPVPALLRKLKVLAHRTRTIGLGEWVEHELGGYPADTQLPGYRGPFTIETVGYFIGGFGFEAHLAIPSWSFTDEALRERLFTASFRESIAEVESLAAQPNPVSNWSPEAVAYYNRSVNNGTFQSLFTLDTNLVSVRQHISPHVLVGVMDAVRNRALDLALALEDVAPTAGQPDATPDANTHAAAVINTFNFLAPVGPLAIGNNQVTQVTIALPSPGDPDTLIRYLREHGVPSDHLEELQALIQQDQSEADANAPNKWRRVAAWLGRAATDVGTGALANAIATGGAAFLQ